MAAAAGPEGKGSMQGPFLNHEHACKVMDKAPLLEITDFCMRKTMRLHYRPRDEVDNVKLPPRAPLGARALDSSWAACGGPHSHPLAPPFAGIGPAASQSLQQVFQVARWLQVPTCRPGRSW